MKFSRILLAGALAFLPLADAAAGSGTITTKDAGGVTRTFVVTTDGSGNFVGQAVICDQSAAANCATVSSNALSVNVTLSTPEGATSDAAATAGSVGSINAKLRLMTTQLDTISTAVQGSIPAGTATIGNVGSATGSAAPASAVYLGANGSGATGGLLRGLITCDLHQKYDASDNGSKTLVTGVSGRKIYVCGYMLATGGTATNLKLREGSDADCATNGADLTPAWQLVANDKIGAKASFWDGLAVSTVAYFVCVNASAGNAHQAEIWYAIL